LELPGKQLYFKTVSSWNCSASVKQSFIQYDDKVKMMMMISSSQKMVMTMIMVVMMMMTKASDDDDKR